MPQQEDRITAITNRVYQSMSRQLRCDNPIFNTVTYCLSSDDATKPTKNDLLSISEAIGVKLTTDGYIIDVSYIDLNPKEPLTSCRFIGIIREKVIT